MQAASDRVSQILIVAASMPFVVALLDAALSDLRHWQIPNRAPLWLLADFAAVALVDGFSRQDWFLHLAIGLLLFGAGVTLFAFRLWGGGDAKLVAAVGLWIGLDGLPRFLLVMSVAGFGLSLATLAAQYLLRSAAVVSGGWRNRFCQIRQVPYGLAIAAAGLDWWIGVAW